MSIFGKPVSQIAPADLDELLRERAVENARLEFKSEVPSKEETLKKLSSFANTFGGFLVVGAKAKSADGKIEGLPGVDIESGYKQKIVQWCFDGANPPLTVQVSEPIAVSSTDGKSCYVIHVPESDAAPHFINGRKGIWIRTDEFSARFEARLANETELRHLLDRRRLILERRTALLDRAKGRFDIFAARIKPMDIGPAFYGRARLGSLLELCVVPRFPARPLCEAERLQPTILTNRVRWRGTVFPRTTNAIIAQHESAIMLGPGENEASFFEVNVWGLLYYGTKIDEKTEQFKGIHLYQFVGTLLVFIRHAGEMLNAMGYSGPVQINLALSRIRSIKWVHAPGGLLSSETGSELDDDLEFSLDMGGNELRERLDGVAMDLLKVVFFAVNWPDLVDTEAKLQELIKKGRDFNRWSS